MNDDKERYNAEDGDRMPSKKGGLGCMGAIFIFIVILIIFVLAYCLFFN
ncbi:MAG: hypothetical protein WCK10_01125 [Candidatus Staskawiczbacteria bacterium]